MEKSNVITWPTKEAISLKRPNTVLAREYYDVALFEQQAKDLIDQHKNIEHDTWRDEPKINARTAIFEELTAKGHLSHIELDMDVETANELTLRRLLNGWSDHLPGWEKQRRFYEIVEELIVQNVWSDVQSGILPPDTIVGTISNYPELASDDQAHHMGYRNLNHKGMVRSHHFEKGQDGQWRRIVEQISRSNSNDGSSEALMRAMSKEMCYGSTEVLANQIISSRKDLPDGAVSIARKLDSFAGQYIRYGEDTRNIYPPLPSYDEIRKISHEREDQAEYFINQLADIERKINLRFKSGEINYEQKLAEYREERTKIVNEICLLDPSYAKDARGEKSAGYYEKASLAMASGNDELGMQHFEAALRSADPRASAVCGGIGFDEQRPGLNEEGLQMYQNAKDAREFWKWKKGLCAVSKCPTRPNKVEVGPCNVCRKCQGLFDADKDPNRIYKSGHNLGRIVKSLVEVGMEPFRKWNKRYDAEMEQKRVAKLSERRKMPEIQEEQNINLQKAA